MGIVNVNLINRNVFHNEEEGKVFDEEDSSCYIYIVHTLVRDLGMRMISMIYKVKVVEDKNFNKVFEVVVDFLSVVKADDKG